MGLFQLSIPRAEGGQNFHPSLFSGRLLSVVSQCTSCVDSNWVTFGALPVNLYQRLLCHVCIYLYVMVNC